MKTEEALKEKFYRVFCETIERAKKEAYNEALVDACLCGRVEYVMVKSGDNPVYEYRIDKQSILNLKKEL